MIDNRFLRNDIEIDIYNSFIVEIINEYIAIASVLEIVERPVLLFLGGAPNSGKSTLTKVKDVFSGSTNYITVSQDDVKSKMQRKLGISTEIEKEWRREYQKESWRITEKILLELIKRGYNIVYDSTLGNPTKSQNLIDYINANNLAYDYEIDILYAEINELYERNKLRVGHYVELKSIEYIYNQLPSSICALIKYCQRIAIWDNSIDIPENSENHGDVLLENRFMEIFFDLDDNVAVIHKYRRELLRSYFGDYYQIFIEYLRLFTLYDEEYNPIGDIDDLIDDI